MELKFHEESILAMIIEFFFYYLGFTPRQDYSTYFEQCQLQGGAKMGDPQEKPPEHMQAQLGSSQVTRARLEPRAVR